ARADRALAVGAGAAEWPRRAAGGRWRSVRAVSGAVAASLCALLIAGALLLKAPLLHTSRLGEVLRVPLPDGSTLVLNSDSRVRVDFDARRRRVELLRGEALFEVARDPARPFAVSAGQAQVVAVGTAFSVQRSEDGGMRVIVREGIVDVAGGAEDAPAPVRVAANFQAVARPGQDLQMHPLAVEEVGRRLAWRDGMLAFDGDTLAQAAARFARYSTVRILVDEPEVAQRRVAGLYSATDPAGFAEAVATSLGLRVERDSEGIHLRSHAAPRTRPPPDAALRQ
ncbi:FecR domain-containing protein, partial [Luteimonas sp. Y-2-2-4F]